MATVNFNSLEACKEAWINYHYENNTKGVSKTDISKIKELYGSQLANWKPENTTDENEYIITDDSSVTSLAVTSATTIAGVVATKAANTGAINGIINSGGYFVNSAGEAIATPKGSFLKADTFAAYNPNNLEAVEMAEKANNASAVGFMVECTVGLATGIAYEARKANKDEYQKLMELQSQMEKYSKSLETTEEIILTDSSTITNLTETAEDISEELTEEIEKLQMELDLKNMRKQELLAKSQSPEGLSESELSELELLETEISGLTDKIKTLSEKSSTELDEINDASEDVQENMESASEEVIDIQEVTDLAESFDEDTKKMCILESVAQGLNVVSSTKGAASAFSFAASGAALFGSTLWANAFGVMGLTGAGLSAKGVVEQSLFAADISDEIKLRGKIQSSLAEVSKGIDTNNQELQAEIELVETTEDIISDVDVETVTEEKIPVPKKKLEEKDEEEQQ